MALADCEVGAYVNRSPDGADQSAELVTAGSENCTQEYGLSPIEAISATFPCGTTRPQGGGYLINFCDESEGSE